MIKHYIVTGAAGFIGYHFTKKLLEENFNVLGIDNLNNYYDINLKKMRLDKLKIHKNFTFYQVDICNLLDLNKIFKNNPKSIVVHLAAQAGVRLSETAPLTYFDSNANGFFNILEVTRKNNHEKLIFASSSSVYGDSKNPFCESDKKLVPKSLYGLTKLSNEFFARSFSLLNGIPSIGLRFFSVYGPWGRPDMAYYKFSEKIMTGQPITLFNQGKNRRDMTYIDDIVNGVYYASCKEIEGNNSLILNLGNTVPIETNQLVQEIENHYNKKAEIINEDSTSEILSTCSDNTLSYEQISYEPKTSFKEGMMNFFNWFDNFVK